MPNWISNRLVVKGDPTTIRNFLDAIRSDDQPFDFERITPSPELIKHAVRVYHPIGSGQGVEEWYAIDERQHRRFTPEEEKQLDALGYRCWHDWACANWGTKWNACEVELDESTVALGYVVITFETAWVPPWPILQRLREMFPKLAFCCGWADEEETFYRYVPSEALAIARSEREGLGQHAVTTLYQTRGKSREFFLETKYSESIEPLTSEEAYRWMVAPDVELLVLLHPDLPELQQPGALGAAGTRRQASDRPTAEPDSEEYPDDYPF